MLLDARMLNAESAQLAVASIHDDAVTQMAVVAAPAAAAAAAAAASGGGQRQGAGSGGGGSDTVRFASCSGDGSVRLISLLPPRRGEDEEAFAMALQSAAPHTRGSYVRAIALSRPSGVLYSAGSDGALAATCLTSGARAALQND